MQPLSFLVLAFLECQTRQLGFAIKRQTPSGCNVASNMRQNNTVRHTPTQIWIGLAMHPRIQCDRIGAHDYPNHRHIATVVNGANQGETCYSTPYGDSWQVGVCTALAFI